MRCTSNHDVGDRKGDDNHRNVFQTHMLLGYQEWAGRKVKSESIHAYKIIVRTKKEDSAFLYTILEAQEGLTAYSTLDFKNADPNRDVELIIPPMLVDDVRALLADMKDIVTILADPA